MSINLGPSQLPPLAVNPPEEPADDRFYVVLSGLVSLIEYKGRFRAYMFYLKDHEHLAGQWLAEQEIPLGFRATLKGVKPGNCHLTNCDGIDSPLMEVRSIPSIKDPEVWAYIDLPLPRKKYFLNRGKVKVTDKHHELLITPTYLAGTRVLEYELDTDFDKVYLETKVLDATNVKRGIAWWANGHRSTVFNNHRRVGSLHLIDGPRTKPRQDHNRHEYGVNGRVLLGKNSTVKFEDLDPNPVPNTPYPVGLSVWETLPLDWRVGINSAFTDYLRTGKFPYKNLVSGGCKPCCSPVNGIRPAGTDTQGSAQ